MHVPIRRGLVAAVLAGAVLTLTACGGSDNSEKDFEKQANAAIVTVKAAGSSLGRTISGAGSTTDAVLARQLDDNKAEVDAALAKVKALDPTNDADRKLVNDLSDALTKVSADLGSLSDSVSVSDATASKEKAAQLIADSAVVKAADHALATAVAPSSSK